MWQPESSWHSEVVAGAVNPRSLRKLGGGCYG